MVLWSQGEWYFQLCSFSRWRWVRDAITSASQSVWHNLNRRRKGCWNSNPFMIKTLDNVGVEGAYFDIITVIYDTPTANVILWWKAESLPLRAFTVFIHPSPKFGEHLFSHYLEPFRLLVSTLFNSFSNSVLYFTLTFIYLAALGLGCGIQHLPSSLWHTGSLVLASGIQLPDQRSDDDPLH